MEFDLKEVSITLVLGAYALLGLEVLVHSLYGSNLFRRVQARAIPTDGRALAVAVTVCFATGMLLEDLSNSLVDDDTPAVSRVLERVGLRTDDQIKWQTLLGEEPQKELHSLGLEAACRGLFGRYLGADGSAADKFMTSRYQLSESDSAGWPKLARSFYYVAKNRVYRESNYYSELRHLQLRIDFARSFSAVSLLLAFATLVLLIPKIIFPSWGFVPGRALPRRARGRLASDLRAWRRRIRNSGRGGAWYNWLRRAYLLDRKRVWALGRAVAALGCFLLSALIGAVAYNKEEEQFDRRVYGYFLSLHQEEVAQGKGLNSHCRLLTRGEPDRVDGAPLHPL